MTEPTTQDLMDRIEELEKSLAPPPEPPSMNELLRAEIDRARDGNTFTVDARKEADPEAPKTPSADGGKSGPHGVPQDLNAAMNRMIRNAKRGY